MKKNIGKVDFIVRLVIAIAIAGLYIGGIIGGTFGIVLLVIAAIALLTAIINICPLYTIFGISTCSKDK